MDLVIATPATRARFAARWATVFSTPIVFESHFGAEVVHAQEEPEDPVLIFLKADSLDSGSLGD